MKKTLLLFALSLCLNSCMAQKTEPVKKITIPLTVNTIAGEEVTLRSETGHLLIGSINPNAYTIPENLHLEEGRKYYVTYEILERGEFKIRINILGFTTHPDQAKKDNAKLYQSLQ